jgi:hypothetical protein
MAILSFQKCKRGGNTSIYLLLLFFSFFHNFPKRGGTDRLEVEKGKFKTNLQLLYFPSFEESSVKENGLKKRKRSVNTKEKKRKEGNYSPFWIWATIFSTSKPKYL